MNTVANSHQEFAEVCVDKNSSKSKTHRTITPVLLSNSNFSETQ